MENKNRELFNENIILKLKKIYDKGYSVNINRIIKTNDTILHGICIREENNSIAPTIYIEEYFDKYSEGKTSVDEIVQQISTKYENNKFKHATLDTDTFNDFDKIKGRIVLQLISREKNKEYLSSTPFVPFCDLAIIFKIIVSMKETEMSKVTITNELLKQWNVGIDTIYKIAKENSEFLLPGKITSLKDVIKKILRKNILNDYKDISMSISEKEIDDFINSLIPSQEGPQMYVAQNSNGIDGATVMLYDNLISDFANKLNKDLFIIPSSIHEVIMVPDNGSMHADVIRNMVIDVNSSQVTPEEVLSNNVYKYNRDTDSIIIAF